MTELWVGAVIALGTSMVAGPVVLLVLQRLQLLDRPNERSSHQAPTPRGGGLAPAIGATAGLVAVPLTGAGTIRTGILVAAAGFGLIGLVDDWRGLAPLPRLGWQVAAGGLALVWLLHGLDGPLAWKAAFTAGCLLWLVAYVNAFNFMDGINGIAAAQVLVAGGAWWVIGRVEDVPALAVGAAVIAAATLAFVPLNYPQARVFLGDVGSYFIGAWLATLVIVGLRGGLAIEAALAPVSLYLTDTATTIVRRVRAAEAWYLPHRNHAYQRLTQLGWSHTRTTALVAATMAICSALGALSLTDSLALRAAGDVILAAVLVAYVVSPQLLRRTRCAAA
ncbi:MAG: glycosyltransferase family 4 protein [Actinomycetota bacterium]|nr:glycosyltransferase family 4 protein [Actinomycetota bacterium]